MLGDKIIRYAVLSSTNDEAKARSRVLPDGSVITALRQSAGRGRQGRVWESDSYGGLYFSIILRPHIPAAASPSLALAAGIAARRAIAEVPSLDPLLKWPNDLLINGKKICGVLIEARAPAAQSPTFSAQGSVELICGIGINVNNDGFSRGISGKAASLFTEKGIKYSLDEVMYAALRHFDDVYNVWLGSGFAALKDEYAANCVHFRGSRAVSVRNGEGTLCSGYAEGVAGDGGLIVTTETGERKTITSGEVSIR
ncbi:MAG: biotin--[acetyl-CoA-carboxylase] ligase [Defluviitaleaceae bacterium]|nr:biotin--[acetyl-CoA-carboxylase] ligase [Defluviitaleaceae bacterium]